jgi:two-component system, chemotaxis family, protein-glutamate methylesterase/glutaminase
MKVEMNRSSLQTSRATIHAVVMGASAAGGRALVELLSRLPADFRLPIMVVRHLHPDDDGGFAEHLDRASEITVVTVCDKQPITPGQVYVAPANYHLLVERNGTLALSTEGRVSWSRPSIDVLFDSAANVWGPGLMAVLLSGASSDGTQGLGAVKSLGGLTVVQDPATAPYPLMPQSAINVGAAERVMNLKDIGLQLVQMDTQIGACVGAMR